MSAPLLARVQGAGPTGALAALALSSVGWSVDVVDPLRPDQLVERSRAYALTHSSRQLLQRLGLWRELSPGLAPFRSLQLCDLELGEQLPFDCTDLGKTVSREPGRGAVGWILQHRQLMELLLERLQAAPGIRLLLGGAARAAEPDSPVDLIVAADGSGSPCRQALGVGTWRLPYRQACLSVQVRLRGSAPDQAWELFRAQGPFAVLPLGGDHAQLVWSAPASRLRALEGLDPAAFLDSLAGVLPEPLQADALLDAPRAFPVALQLARRFHRGNTVLVGETLHRCHPVGGQGLNLCWRDVDELRAQAERVARGRLAVTSIGRAYGRRRWGDVLLTLAATDLMVRLFSNRQPLALGLRRLALTLLRRVAPIRRLSLKAMTLGPCQLLGRWSE
jgi:2-octaprenyl-6-methoxyphenol hydroxylase